MTLNHPLRLAIGSHAAGSGKGCAMNVISWENGDSIISDAPPCADRMLARIVQRVNDSYCRHTENGLLCAACSVVVLDLAHRTVGTGNIGLTFDERRRVWVGVAADQARQVLHLAKDKVKAEHYIGVAEAYANGGPKPAAAAAAAYAYAAAAAAAAADAAAYAYAAAAAAAAADAAAYAAADAAAARLRLAHRAIDTFNRLTGYTAPTPVEANVYRAYDLMVAR